MSANWATRSSAPGVLLATDFSNDEDVLPYRFANAGTVAQYNELIKRVVRHDDDGVPCLRLNIIANDPLNKGYSQGQAWRRRFRPVADWPNDGDGVGNGPLWIQFGLKIPASRLVPFQPNSGSWKFAIVANMSTSNPLGMPDQSSNLISHVLTNRVGRGRSFPTVYRHNDRYTNGEPFEDAFPWDPQGNDLNLSPGWDRGASFTDYRDRYCAYSDTRGCPLWPVDEWVWFQYRTLTRTWGGTQGNELDFSWALPGDTKWSTLHSHRNYLVGSNAAPWVNGFNALWLTAFETDRTIPAGVDTWLEYRHLIVSTEEPAFPSDETQPNGEPMADVTLIVPEGTNVKVLNEIPSDQSLEVKRLTDKLAALRANAVARRDADAAKVEGQDDIDVIDAP